MGDVTPPTPGEVEEMREPRIIRTSRAAPPCPRCGRIHVPSAAVGRFTWVVPMYRAQHEGAPLRDSREQADRDQCDWNVSLGSAK